MAKLFSSSRNGPKLLLATFELLCFISSARPFTVIMSDSNSPPGLVDEPQTGFSINQFGAKTDTQEQQAVYDIMRATGNDWAADIPDVCRGRWHGIECKPDKDNVYHIVSLSFGALSDDTAFPTCDPTQSYISPSIIRLPYIKALFFYRCFSHNPQPIPSFLGHLGSTLQSLVLRENGHVGHIPTELGNLTHLKVLDLHKNNLNGSIPVDMGRIIGLRSLDLSGNKLSGPIPSVVFPRLNVLDLNQNLLIGPIPSSIGSCQSLIKLDLSHNRLVGPIPESINGLRDLMLMDLSYNRISGAFPKSLGGLTSLQDLIMKGNPMGSTTVPGDLFDGMLNLMTVILSYMNLQGHIPQSLGQLRSLRVLHLDGNHLNGSIPESFRDLENLNELRLNDNFLSGPIPLKNDMIWKMKTKLRLYKNSALCYTPDSGIEAVFDSTYNSGIGSCDMQRSGSARAVVQHLSNTQAEKTKVSSAAAHEATVPVKLLHLAATVLLCLGITLL